MTRTRVSREKNTLSQKELSKVARQRRAYLRELRWIADYERKQGLALGLKFYHLPGIPPKEPE